METVRFIPAGAGNSILSWTNAGVIAVYPRWRGELFETLLCKINEIGLSPLARGTPGIKK